MNLSARALAHRAQKRERRAFTLMIAAGTGPHKDRAQRLYLQTAIDLENRRLG